MEWLTNLTNWLKEQVVAVWAAFVAFMNDLMLGVFESALHMAYLQFSLIPIPDFLDGYSLCSILSQTGPVVGWALMTFKVAEALGMIGAAYAFRMVRKLATLFQW